MKNHRLAAGLALLAAMGCATERRDVAELVLVNGKIVTVDGAGTETTALAVKDGRILAVGTDVEIRGLAGETTRVLDLDGRIAIPGFIEGHGHFMGIGEAKVILDLRPTRTWNEVVEMVAIAAQEAPAGTWIRGRGWHQDKWERPPVPAVEGLPVHDSLSRISGDNPVILTHASGHASLVNARALELAGIDGKTHDPPGGEILRDAAGRPTGFLRETAQQLVAAVRGARSGPHGEGELEASLDEMQRMARLAAEECVRKGITTFQDAGSSLETIGFLQQMVDAGEIPLRLWVMIREPNDRLRERLADFPLVDHGDHRLTVRAIKVTADGALGSRGAWLLQPYADAPGSTGLNVVPLDDLRETADLALAHRMQLCVHAIGDRANREVLDIYESALERSGADDLRWRIEHAQHLHPDDIPRFGKLGVVASMQAIHCTSDAPWVPDRLGERRSREGAYVWQDLMRAGAVVTNGTDAPVEDVSPIASFHAAVARRLPDDTVFYPEQRMSRMEALRSYTANVAYAGFEEDLKGSLEPGKLADVVVLSRDILTVPEEEIPATEVIYTIIGGEVVYGRDDRAAAVR